MCGMAMVAHLRKRLRHRTARTTMVIVSSPDLMVGPLEQLTSLSVEDGREVNGGGPGSCEGDRGSCGCYSGEEEGDLFPLSLLSEELSRETSVPRLIAPSPGGDADYPLALAIPTLPLKSEGLRVAWEQVEEAFQGEEVSRDQTVDLDFITMRLLDRQDGHCQFIVFASWSPSPFDCDGTIERSCQVSANLYPFWVLLLFSVSQGLFSHFLIFNRDSCHFLAIPKPRMASHKVFLQAPAAMIRELKTWPMYFCRFLAFPDLLPLADIFGFFPSFLDSPE
ncbi:hypothetical protein Taro_045205 [Colocasia esculenta]|uniref:Uncharacterized protein n=1 Tax=Colocasia esculenta TaxID=4460 RepID=A0A843WW13_COLES|nr:hypothetical protein [Colocasia esculenta]